MIDSDWQGRCGIQKIIQSDNYGCGIACLAMVAGTTYEHSRRQFDMLGLGVRRGCRPAYSTSSGEMRMAVASLGLILQARRWSGWGNFNGLGILKVRDDWRGAKGRWHWAVAFRHPVFEIALFDPHQSAPSFVNLPQDTICVDFSIYEPKGEWLQIEQAISLIIA